MPKNNYCKLIKLIFEKIIISNNGIIVIEHSSFLNFENMKILNLKNMAMLILVF